MIESPCVKECHLIKTESGTQACGACKRTLWEIANWSALTPEIRSQIISTLHER